MQDELDVLRDVSRRLDAAGIAYMLTGSMAMNLYAQPRMTRDVDIVVELSGADASKIVAAFSPDYYVAREAVDESIKRKTMFNLIHEKTIIKVDCIVRKNSEYRKIEFERRRRLPVDGFETWTVSREDLILSKLDWAKDSHSDFQLRDVRNLMSVEYDREYVERWARELGLWELMRECL